MKRLLLPLLCAVLLLTGCAQPGATAQIAPAECDRLVVYTPLDETLYAPLMKEFQERTGIWTEVVTGSFSELIGKIEQGDEPACDLLLGGSAENLEAYADLFAPCPEALLTRMHADCCGTSGAWCPLSRQRVVLIYNSKLVRMNPPDGWEDLLDPAWRGKIAFADGAGAGYPILAALTQVLPGDASETLAAFAENLAGQTPGSVDKIVDRVADGSFYIGVTFEDSAQRGIAAGYDIAITSPCEGGVVTADGMAVVAGCAHAENAQKFLEFAVLPEVQRHLFTTLCCAPVLADMPDGDAADGFAYDITEAAKQRAALLALWQAYTEGADA